MPGAGALPGQDEGSLMLGIDLNTLDLDALLGPLSTRTSKSAGILRPRPPHAEARQLSDVTASQQRSLELPVPPGARQAKAQNSLAHGPGLMGGRCGERLRFTVTAVSADGEVFKEGGNRVTALVTGRNLLSKTHPEPRPFVEDQQDGTYHVQFVCATPGDYDIMVHVDGVALPMCPMVIHVRPGPPGASNSQVRGEGAEKCKLGASSEFTIQAVDEFGNLCSEGGARFGVRASAHAKLHEVSDNEDGTYTVCYSIPEWAQAPIRLEVLLDGMPVKGSPLTPQILGGPGRDAEKQPSVAKAKASGGSTGSLADLSSLAWLRENRPGPIPVVPPADVTRSALVGGQGLSEGLSSEESASRMAWRAADEWRRLAEVREALERSREQLDEHQAVLINVGDAVQKEVERLQDWEKRMAGKQAELSEVERRLESTRAEISRQYLQQQRAMEISSSEVSHRAALLHPTPRSHQGASFGEDVYPQAEVSALAIDSDASPLDTGKSTKVFNFSTAEDRESLSVDSTQPAQEPLRRQEGSAEEELIILQRGIEQKKRALRVLEEEASSSAVFGAGRSLASKEVHPMLQGRPQPAPAPDFGDVKGRMRPSSPRSGPLDPPKPPPLLSNVSVDGPTNQARSERRQDLLRSPPPPPTPPPSIPPGGHGRSSSSRSYPDAASLGSLPASPQAAVQSPSGASDEIGKAMQQLFSSFASRAAGSVAMPRGGRSGRVALGLQDYLRMANASQLRLSQAELEAVFAETVDHFGNHERDQALAFELFVELLVLTARRQFPDFEDADATSVLFEVHLLPLARRLKRLDSGGSNSTLPEASSASAF
mmetsp:Transcript_20407/g.36560  ORF Transcript_20407/g.36560 Transcript_20407/m.36560 type:complete len:826 (+) Transcript_20407:64-2541(+)